MKANFMVFDADICHLANPLKLDVEFVHVHVLLC